MQVLKLPKIEALDLRPFEVIVAEHNALHPEFPWRIWRKKDFEESVKCKF